MPNRIQCYAEIREAMKNGVRHYYEKFADRAGDERSIDAIKHSMQGLAAIFAVLDRYEIKRHTDTAAKTEKLLSDHDIQHVAAAEADVEVKEPEEKQAEEL